MLLSIPLRPKKIELAITVHRNMKTYFIYFSAKCICFSTYSRTFYFLYLYVFKGNRNCNQGSIKRSIRTRQSYFLSHHLPPHHSHHHYHSCQPLLPESSVEKKNCAYLFAINVTIIKFYFLKKTFSFHFSNSLPIFHYRCIILLCFKRVFSTNL